MALVIRVGRGNGWRRQGDDGRTERQDSRRELEGSVGTEGRGCACASSQASQSHSRSSTTVPHDPWSDPTTASVYRRHPHSQQPLVSRATPEGSTKLRASSTGFESFCKSWRGGGLNCERGSPFIELNTLSDMFIAFPLGDIRVESSVGWERRDGVTLQQRDFGFDFSSCLQRIFSDRKRKWTSLAEATSCQCSWLVNLFSRRVVRLFSFTNDFLESLVYVLGN